MTSKFHYRIFVVANSQSFLGFANFACICFFKYDMFFYNFTAADLLAFVYDFNFFWLFKILLMPSIFL